MNAVIIGKGIVGQATALTLKDNINIQWYDPPKKLSADFSIADVVFICCPSHEVSYYVSKLYKHPRVYIRSTIKPEIVKDTEMAVYPEFLTESKWEKDALNPLCFIFGGSKEQLKALKTFSKLSFKNEYLTDNKTAALMKIITNAYTSSKIMFFNYVYDLCLNLGMDYDELRKCITTDPRIHETGTFVPGPDGQFGFGGKCLAKDTQYLLDLLDNPILKNIIKKNNELRNK
jgi:UDP-glucose 6-dehydrogenase